MATGKQIDLQKLLHAARSGYNVEPLQVKEVLMSDSNSGESSELPGVVVAGSRSKPLQVYVEEGTLENPVLASSAISIGVLFVFVAGIILIVLTITVPS